MESNMTNEMVKYISLLAASDALKYSTGSIPEEEETKLLEAWRNLTIKEQEKLKTKLMGPSIICP